MPLPLSQHATTHPAAAMPKQQQQQLGWPKLSQKQLTPQRLNDHMLLVPGVLSLAEAQRFIDIAEAAGFQHQGSRGPRYGEAFRDNDRIAMDDPQLAEQLWNTGLNRTMQGVVLDGAAPVGLNPNIRFYRYSPGQKFGKHIDDSNELGGGRFTGYTLLVYLSGRLDAGSSSSSSGSSQQPAAASGGSKGSSSSSGGSKDKTRRAAAQQAGGSSNTASAVQQLVGGETVFYGARGKVVASVAPAPGLALLHRHGEEHCLEHEGAAVVQGVKYILRSDVVFSR